MLIAVRFVTLLPSELTPHNSEPLLHIFHDFTRAHAKVYAVVCDRLMREISDSCTQTLTLTGLSFALIETKLIGQSPTRRPRSEPVTQVP